MEDKKVLPPRGKVGKETYKEFRDRVVKDYLSKGYSLDNLSEINKTRFCIGAGCRKIDPNAILT